VPRNVRPNRCVLGCFDSLWGWLRILASGHMKVIALLARAHGRGISRARPATKARSRTEDPVPRKSAADPDRRQRFELEAHTVAALNHPNIVAIYDVGMEGGTSYIVTELIDGEPLRVGTAGLRKSLDCAVQIADGLAAHTLPGSFTGFEPANILLTRDGRIKIWISVWRR